MKARGLRVAALKLGVCTVTARVEGPRSAHRVGLRIASLPEPAWERIVTLLAERADLMAAALDGELDPALSQSAGVARIQADPREIEARCSCSTWRAGCKHVVAVQMAVARELRERPALWLRLRGRDATRLFSEAEAVSRLRSRFEDVGVEAAAAFTRSGWACPPPPEILAPQGPLRPEVSWLPPEPLVHRPLGRQVADASARALALLRGEGDGGMALGRLEDLARIAAGLEDRRAVHQLAWRARVRPEVLEVMAARRRARDEPASRPEPEGHPGRGRQRPALRPQLASTDLQQLSLFG